MHDASAVSDLTGIDLSRFVVMQQPRPAKRTGELLKLAARLIGTLPSPRTVTVYATAQESGTCCSAANPAPANPSHCS